MTQIIAYLDPMIYIHNSVWFEQILELLYDESYGLLGTIGGNLQLPFESINGTSVGTSTGPDLHVISTDIVSGCLFFRKDLELIICHGRMFHMWISTIRSKSKI